MTNVLKVLVILVLVSATASAEQAQPNASDDPTVRDHVFLVVLKPGPAWLEGKPVSEQPLSEHGRYVLQRYAEGLIQEAGPFTDNSGGAVIYRADSVEDVEALLAEDPAIADGVLVPRVHPWLLREWDHYLRAETIHAQGTFVPRRTSRGEPDGRDGVTLERQLLEKRYEGDFVGEGYGEMLTATTPVEGSMAYVAFERVTGELAGRRGTFLLQHSASMERGTAGWLTMTVVPDSGTGGLFGLEGEMRIETSDGGYRYDFEYTLPEAPEPR